ncbi:hypothetical protein TRSC58_07112 [Trypanosoma rangeli SC58]|uniref:Retrotransposon hot spot (RHS) protein n=1 Tax=Trypanosoma rangeli SC58 TaxID=429131 RepID=A0A061IW47_TRYRA|nr:hypothetical protein TRSC58_07112 [Trypanosoma rangeli SC58]
MNENVSIENFVAQPRAFIEDGDVLGLILASPLFVAMEDARRLREDARRLTERRVATLRDWKDFADKRIVSDTACVKLDAALQQAEEESTRRENKERPRRPLPEGFYESVFNATWSHVVGFPEGEGENMVVRMEVREGQRPQELWEYTKAVRTFLPVEGEGQFHPPRPRLVILSSEKLWPYSLGDTERIADCYINIEVHRVWKIVEGDLEGVFPPPSRWASNMRPRLLVGTPGMVRSMAVDSYLLYQLPRYDAGQFHVVVYCFGASVFAFVVGRATKTVSWRRDVGNTLAFVEACGSLG